MNYMSSIHLLSQSIISHIAAGEVIERTAYSIKELIENAIDAQASSIRIDLEKSGLERIVVTDNGTGMSIEDAEICFQLHTTSKIHTVEDLHTVMTKGFRGEALASLAAVSELTIETRDAMSDSGIQLVIEKNKIVSKKPIGMPVGTKIIVENLFEHMPARKQFLKSAQAEMRYSLQLITEQAMAHSHIRFFVTHHKKTLLDLPATPQSHERYIAILGSSLFSQMMHIEAENAYISLQGYISQPQLHASRSKNYIFINQRPVQQPEINQIIRQTYGTLLPTHTFPITILHVNIPPHLVDSNVHPRKERVHIYPQHELEELFTQSIRDLLRIKKLTYHDQRWQKSIQPSENQFSIHDAGVHTYAGQLLKNSISDNLLNDRQKNKPNAEIIQVNNLYLIAEHEKGIVLIDQHAAHERILFEKYQKEFAAKSLESKLYLEPKSIQLPIVETEMLLDSLDLFQKIGFEITHFQGNTFRIFSAPVLLKDQNLTQLMLELLNDLSESGKLKAMNQYSQRMLTYLACRSAVKSGDPLTTAQRKILLNELWQCQDYATCPHGRPTYYSISANELASKFKRK